MNDEVEPAWKGPLAGLRVLDFTRVLSGPFTTQLLGDLGADIIKVEPPGGDSTRKIPPHRDGESHYFLGINRSKRSIVIDLKQDAGIELAKRLVSKVDVLIENFRPDVMKRFGLDYETLEGINPRLIYCAMSGFGLSGPMRDRPSFDIVTQALTGVLSVNGEPGRQPVKLGLPMGDLVGGVFGPAAILSALYERSQTGRGRLIDVSLFDGLIGMLGYLGQLPFFTGRDPEPVGSGHPSVSPYGAYRTRDGQIIVACLTDQFWNRLSGILQPKDLAEDPRFATMEDRRRNREALDAIIEAFTSRRTVEEMSTLLDRHDIPNAPILGVKEALAQPHAAARDMLVMAEHQTLGSIPIVGRSVKFSGVSQQPLRAPPVLGQHTDEILRELLDISEPELKKLRETEAVR